MIISAKVSLIYRDSSLGNLVHISVAKLLILKVKMMLLRMRLRLRMLLRIEDDGKKGEQLPPKLWQSLYLP